VIYLAPGHSFQNYSTAVRKDITPHIFSTFRYPALSRWTPENLIYNGKDIDELLSAIRSGENVTLVECSYNSMGAAGKYMAPLFCNYEYADGIIPASFGVSLVPEHSLEQHPLSTRTSIPMFDMSSIPCI
jgi:hypothetical protein